MSHLTQILETIVLQDIHPDFDLWHVSRTH